MCVDRVVPVIKSNKGYRYAYGWSGTPGELWLSLIEKAFAKLYGSYSSIEGGYTGIGIANLTRSDPYMFRHACFSQLQVSSTDVDDVWRKLVRMWNAGFVMGIAWKKEVHGLLTGHAYSILSLYKIKGRRWVKIRNPHARGEWKGRWNESEIARKRLFDLRECDMEVTDDGVFVMLVEDVAKFAEDIDGVDCFSRPPPGRTLMDP